MTTKIYLYFDVHADTNTPNGVKKRTGKLCIEQNAYTRNLNNCDRLSVNDRWIFNGIYRCSLWRRVSYTRKSDYTHTRLNKAEKKHVQMFTYTSSAVTAEVNSSDGIRALFFFADTNKFAFQLSVENTYFYISTAAQRWQALALCLLFNQVKAGNKVLRTPPLDKPGRVGTLFSRGSLLSFVAHRLFSAPLLPSCDKWNKKWGEK